MNFLKVLKLKNLYFIIINDFIETLEDHVRKEMVYREEVSKQLQLVRGKSDK